MPAPVDAPSPFARLRCAGLDLMVPDDQRWEDDYGRLLPIRPVERRLRQLGFRPRRPASARPQPMQRRARATAIVAVATTLLALASCGTPAAAPQAAPPAVGVASPVVEHLPAVRDLTGRLDAVGQVDVRPRVAGQVERVLVADGAEVAAGEVLVELDARPFAAALARAEAVLDAERARADQARLRLERSRTLLETRSVAQQTADDHAAELRAAQAAVSAAEAAVTTAKLELGHTRITAPIAGRIGKVLATRGNLVTGGGPAPATLVATLVGLDPIDVVFDLDEGTFHRIQQRLRRSATGAAGVPVAVAIAGEDASERAGVVSFVDNRVDTRAGSVRLRARLGNADRALIHGAFARVRLEVEPPRPVLLVHERSIQSQLATKYVLAVDADGRTGFRPVRLGEAVGELRVVLEGLAAEDRIVATGVAKVLHPGMPVTPQSVSMRTLTADPAPAPAADATASLR